MNRIALLALLLPSVASAVPVQSLVGRVWLDGETSDTWHPSWGGGLWIGLLSRSNAIAFTVAQSEERTAFYIRAGFSF